MCTKMFTRELFTILKMEIVWVDISVCIYKTNKRWKRKLYLLLYRLLYNHWNKDAEIQDCCEQRGSQFF